tara:strand:- start:604 stop:1056 length:453 start_codon:yes stop_codon:yes gene_type:complete
MSQNRIFREELPGEKKSIINLLMTGYLIAITCMGYIAFYLYIQLAQMDRITKTLSVDAMTSEQFDMLKNRMLKATHQIRYEVLGLAVVGGIVSIIGAIYMFNLVIRPLRKLVRHVEKGTAPPEIKSNNEIKQLLTAINQQLRKVETENED